jgi:hypothetical protein
MAISRAGAGCAWAVAAALMAGATGAQTPETHIESDRTPEPAPVRNPTGWALFSPCAGNCAVAVYGGAYIEDGMEEVLFYRPSFPTDWNFDGDDRLIALTLSRHAATWRRLDFEPELGIGQRLDQSVTEVWAALYARYRGFPWDDYVTTTFALSTGLNVVSDYSEREIERTGETGGYRVMHYFSPEITFALPSRPELELLFRFHHRSGAYGLFNDVGGGVHYGTVGLRFRF